MNKVKGRVLHLQSRLQGDAPSGGQGSAVRLRGNELYRLLSIINKVKRNRTLSAADESDLKEIEEIEQGRRSMVCPEVRFLPPAFSRHDREGVLSWFHNLRQGPLRPLTAEEQTLWKRVGPTGIHGYLRLDGSIQAYLLSGDEEDHMPWTYL